MNLPLPSYSYTGNIVVPLDYNYIYDGYIYIYVSIIDNGGEIKGVRIQTSKGCAEMIELPRGFYPGRGHSGCVDLPCWYYSHTDMYLTTYVIMRVPL